MNNAAGPRWNHNLHYHRIVLDAVPAGARTALDVGTGNGLLAADLRRSIPDVTAIDTDEAVLANARTSHDGIAWVQGDVMSHDFGQRFDVVASVAALHHIPHLRAALQRLSDLTAPGGVLAVVGLASVSRPRDVAWALVGTVQHRWFTWRRGYWEHTAPTVWPPPHSYSEIKRCSAENLPGVRWRQLALWRYALIWHKPTE